MILLVKTSIILLVLLAFYKLVLERESFFASNRLYLMACLVFAVVLPFVSFPKVIDHQGYVSDWLDEETIVEDGESNEKVYSVDPIIDISDEQDLEQNVKEMPTFANNTPVEGEEASAVVSKNNSQTSINWFLMLYLFGVVVLSINLVAQIISTFRKGWKANDKIEDGNYIIVNMDGEVEPCSFFQYIFINPTLYDYDTYEQILAHEKIHVDKRHTLDLIISEIAVILFWFNPFIWLLRMEIEKNIEYQTDATLLESDNKIKQSYQLNLVDIASRTRPLAITTNYNQSLIKQRILKMNGKRSHKFGYWKYSFILPLLMVLVLGLNKPTEFAAQDSPVLEFLEAESEGVDTPLFLPLDTLDVAEEPKSLVVESDKKRVAPQVIKKQENYTEKIENTTIAQSRSSSHSLKDFSKRIFADCKEFEDAVARGDLERVKEILKRIDPDCLKMTKEKIASNKNESKSKVGKEDSKVTVDNSVCERIEDAVNNFDISRTRKLLMEENFDCLKDINGGPTRDTKLLKGLLKYGAKMSISPDKIVHIENVGFEIGLPDAESDCDHPSYMALVEAIKAADRQEIRKILSEDDLPCPLNTNGITNDFPFIKELMKYGPELLVVNRESVIVHGVGVNVDIKAFKDYDSDIDGAINNTTLSQIERIMSNYEISQDNDCLQLLNAVDRSDKPTVQSLLREMNTDCYHKITETSTNRYGSITDSHTLTPLILGAAHGDYEMVRLILNHNADINFQGDGSETALMYGVQSSKLSVVKLLIDEGAKVNTKDEKGFTALDYAEEFGFIEISKFLLTKGAKTGIR